MITRLTKIQLVIFAIVTLVGGAFVGGRYAQVDRLVVDRSYPVTVQLKDSGGLFAGAQVTYRGIGVGRVGKMTVTRSGVVARLDIENSAPKIPTDTVAVVADKSAVGEQFLDLQPRVSTGPFLRANANIAVGDTQIPIPTSKLLVNVNDLVKSVDIKSLRTVVDELGTAFAGTGPDLGRIIDTASQFIDTADNNIDTTHALIQDSSSVLQTQIDKRDDVATFAKNLALLSDTLVSSDPDLRRLLDGGASAAKEVGDVIDENSSDLTFIINNVITANRPLYENTQAVRALFILYPYLLEAAPSALIYNKDQNTYDASFGFVSGLPPINADPAVCNQGYRTDRRPPQSVDPDRGLQDPDCTNAKLVPRNPSKTVVDHNRVAAGSYASGTNTTDKDSWKWLLLGPATVN